MTDWPRHTIDHDDIIELLEARRQAMYKNWVYNVGDKRTTLWAAIRQLNISLDAAHAAKACAWPVPLPVGEEL